MTARQTKVGSFGDAAVSAQNMIVLIAHDTRKDDLLEFVRAHLASFQSRTLVATHCVPLGTNTSTAAAVVDWLTQKASPRRSCFTESHEVF